LRIPARVTNSRIDGFIREYPKAVKRREPHWRTGLPAFN
jgi:hypothetical protein